MHTVSSVQHTYVNSYSCCCEIFVYINKVDVECTYFGSIYTMSVWLSDLMVSCENKEIKKHRMVFMMLQDTDIIDKLSKSCKSRNFDR